MTIRLTQKSGISAKSYRIDEADIERQALQDLTTYRNIRASEGHAIDPNEPLDPDDFVEKVFGISLDPSPIEQRPGERHLGFYDPEKNVIVYDPEACGVDGCILFTVAHEAGHVRFHRCLLVRKDVKAWKKLQENKHLERQADVYASAILAPTQLVLDLLKLEGYVELGQVKTIDARQFIPKMMSRFGLSWAASEVRLLRMKLTMSNRKYSF